MGQLRKHGGLRLLRCSTVTSTPIPTRMFKPTLPRQATFEMAAPEDVGHYA
jgi:hypothetical protein